VSGERACYQGQAVADIPGVCLMCSWEKLPDENRIEWREQECKILRLVRHKTYGSSRVIVRTFCFTLHV
jgi:hypothetical protein